MQSPQTPRWVDVLFTRLLVRYGDAWARKWQGIPEDAIKADWHEQLAPLYAKNPHAIAHGLQNLPPDYPPNSDQFLKLCTGAPQALPALPPATPQPQPEKVATALKMALARHPTHDPARACADALRDRRERMGGRLEPAQKAQLAALEAIGK